MNCDLSMAYNILRNKDFDIYLKTDRVLQGEKPIETNCTARVDITDDKLSVIIYKNEDPDSDGIHEMIDELAYCGYNKKEIIKMVNDIQRSRLKLMAKPQVFKLPSGLQVRTNINYTECDYSNIPHKHYYTVSVFEYDIEPDNMIYDLLSIIDEIIAILTYLL